MPQFNIPKFEPPKEDADTRVIWTTQKVEQTIEAIENGYEVPTPFHENNPAYKKGNIVFEYTELEMDEIKKCARDIVYFANNHCQVMTDEGYMRIKLRDYQEEMLLSFQANRFNICLAPRQIGKTICSAIFLTWFLLFNFDKNVMLLANKGTTTREILDKIRAVVEGLPFFMKPGIIKKDVMSMKFDNECRIMGQNTTKNAGIGFTIHLLFLDEFAHVDSWIAEEFYGNIYPTLSSSQISKIVITSTPNGYNLFQRLWQDSLDRDTSQSEYVPFKVDWWDVPGRDDEWKAREIANLGGSEEEFNKQYGCQFINADSLLLNGHEMNKLNNHRTEYTFVEFDILDDLGMDYSSLKWHPSFDVDFELENKQNFFVMSIDLAEGVGKDYTVINIFKVEVIDPKYYKEITNPGSIFEFFKLRQVGLFRCNTMSIPDFSKVVYALTVELFDPEQIRVVLEYNTYGAELLKTLTTLYPTRNDFDEGIMVQYKHRINTKKVQAGLKLNSENKKIYCQSLKESIRKNRLVLNEASTIDEAKSFSRSKNGTYSAQSGNDDAIMSCVNVCSVFDTVDYTEIVEEYLDFIPSETRGLINDLLEEEGTEGDIYNIYDIL